MELDYKKLLELFEQGRGAEAEVMIETYLRSDMTPEERGAVFMTLGQVHAELTGSVLESYAEELEADNERLKQLDQEEKALLDEVDMAAAQNRLHDL